MPPQPCPPTPTPWLRGERSIECEALGHCANLYTYTTTTTSQVILGFDAEHIEVNKERIRTIKSSLKASLGFRLMHGEPSISKTTLTLVLHALTKAPLSHNLSVIIHIHTSLAQD